MFHSRSGRPLPLPPAKLRFMGENDERFVQVGDELAALLVAYGLTPDSVVLDVGCGYGRLGLGILHSTDHRGRYLGFDILQPQIDWCRTTISPSFPMMRFAHLDIRNERYNPGGTIEPAKASFPARSASTDVCALFSVFTHLYRPDIERYLDEIRRVLRPGGVAVTTWFLFDQARLPDATSSSATYPMIHVLDEVTRYSEDGNPLRAIAYEESAVRGMARTAGLEVLAVDRGTWTGEPGRVFQDIVVLRRSASDTTVDPAPEPPGIATRAAAASRRTVARVRSTAGGIRKLARRARRRTGRLAGRG
ncbi:MAG TPA: class I SAM-dependent methyltransferase [Patescibacteria group bacterium]|nr:class I SAM-dependent methyltransferase [Patescibacteria group bacterium]